MSLSEKKNEITCKVSVDVAILRREVSSSFFDFTRPKILRVVKWGKAFVAYFSGTAYRSGILHEESNNVTGRVTLTSFNITQKFPIVETNCVRTCACIIRAPAEYNIANSEYLLAERSVEIRWSIPSSFARSRASPLGEFEIEKHSSLVKSRPRRETELYSTGAIQSHATRVPFLLFFLTPREYLLSQR